MWLYKLHEEVLDEFGEIPETGMGYHYVMATIKKEGSQKNSPPDPTGFLVFGSTYAIPLWSYIKWVGIGDSALKKSSIRLGPLDGMKATKGKIDVKSDFSKDSYKARAALSAELGGRLTASPTLPPPGTALTVKAKTSGEDAFLRFSYTKLDPRINIDSGDVAAGTYGTTMRDGAIITSGLSAVGRYALPIPLPAAHVFVLLPDKGIDVEFGAAIPMFGQAGGGVETFFPNLFTNKSRSYSIPPY